MPTIAEPYPRLVAPRLREALDDEAVLAAARRDPVGFVDGLPARAILDEVQRVPEIFTSLKAAIDARRSAGRFILTGSANVLLVSRLAESLAGRMGLLRLHPLSRCELERHPPRFINALFAGRFKTRVFERLGSGLVGLVVAGGYPAALARRAGRPGIATTSRPRCSATCAICRASTRWTHCPGCWRWRWCIPQALST